MFYLLFIEFKILGIAGIVSKHNNYKRLFHQKQDTWGRLQSSCGFIIQNIMVFKIIDFLVWGEQAPSHRVRYTESPTITRKMT